MVNRNITPFVNEQVLDLSAEAFSAFIERHPDAQFIVATAEADFSEDMHYVLYGYDQNCDGQEAWKSIAQRLPNASVYYFDLTISLTPEDQLRRQTSRPRLFDN